MSSPQKGICKVCGTDTKDRRKAYCRTHAQLRRVHSDGTSQVNRGGKRYRRTKLGTPDRHDKRQDGLATTRRLFYLRQRADAELPLFERNERANSD